LRVVNETLEARSRVKIGDETFFGTQNSAFSSNYEMSIAINCDFLINIIVECVLCLVINHTAAHCIEESSARGGEEKSKNPNEN
jgi:hypothetical protein